MTVHAMRFHRPGSVRVLTKTFVPRPRISTTACTTKPIAVGVTASVGIVERMPNMAMGFLAVDSRHPLTTSEHVLAEGFGLKMAHLIASPVYAESNVAAPCSSRPVVAQVIEREPFGDRPLNLGPDIAMHHPELALDLDASVTADLRWSRPDEAPFFGSDAQCEDLLECEGTSHFGNLTHDPTGMIRG